MSVYVSFVRIPDCKYHLIARAIDLGADGIMLPRTESLEQVKEAIESLRFAPVGRTGCGGHGQFKKGEGYEGFQKSRYLFVQIESQPGIDILPNHTLEKLNMLNEGNLHAFINPNEWQPYNLWCIENLENMVMSEKNNE